MLGRGFELLAEGMLRLAEGMANLFSGPPRRPKSIDEQLHDAWQQVGDDLRQAMREIDEVWNK